MKVDFYHLAAPVERVLPRIAERLLTDGERLLVVAAEDAVLARLDGALWAYQAASFLPHGRAGQGDEAMQPVLLSASAEALNGASNIALVDGLWRDEALGFDRAFHFFDEETVEAARLAWKALKDRDGVERRYWRQDDGGRWEQVA